MSKINNNSIEFLNDIIKVKIFYSDTTKLVLDSKV